MGSPPQRVLGAAPPRAAPDVYLRDEIAESLAKHAERLPEARELLAALDGRGPEAARPPSPGAATSRLAVRGLTGSARGFLASWLAGDPLELSLAMGAACGALSTRALGGVDGQPSMEEARGTLAGQSAGSG